MRESVEMLLKKMGEDKLFAEKILSQTEKEKVIEIAKDEGVEITIEDIDEVNEMLTKALKMKKEGELSEEELENVAGGVALEILTVSVSASLVSTIFSATMSLISASTLIRETMSVREDEPLDYNT
ncbi:MAG: Nif11-like leader peptide family natural product precursor [Eubacteriales bacterium]|nr:Nif11-like leader peptide family natural product precursor [Eubacteriales bacterium]